MIIKEINGNKLLLVNLLTNFNTQSIINKLKENNLDTAILYKNIKNNIFNYYVLEKDNTESNFCGNGCIAIALILKKYYSNIILINKINIQTEIKIINNNIIFSLDITESDDNLFLVNGEPHKIYYIDKYNKEEQNKIGEKNIPKLNTTFVFNYNEKYYFSTFERGVNEITKSCGTGAFASIYYIINKLNNKKINCVYTLDNIKYNFENKNNKYFIKYYI